MSFQNFDSFQNQHPAADAAAAAPAATADTTMTGQADPSTAPFQGAAPGEGAAAGPQQGNEGKTTLWYVHTCLHTPSAFPSGFRYLGKPWATKSGKREDLTCLET
ncbi:hypothetical protein BJX64DRAFT_69116 [Aspergillus heterothallicus]